ncbi:MAG: hypothetical protein UT86_C0001G0194 [Candidatus Magasanikbacteria bacterium GW2011_GWC2_40_17]|uniref:Uncharacterized protein n=1 Tax=Candidatus Magasanikbacteria bacterium GW2011_GWA2_42_32 TaxID=1619039 RepID=A0A0G1A990_9BACT|nr:MAG: hypothetical protein UT86_C0001G0194 [Candidatus Magasanikbacteria bacterium GW2011_GWC2_40_17]KKS57554.1 MAG: hypothetical protein UV20_C0001G0194 [Candidatus Magasanikbacteria bacterium GW2011_GWA2_42_32]OGH85430.1 MAG: hypothetical protein A2294_03425 [Candidatus Magasanikbacteria bacterium RIFOXYB2_FULL_38_10]
MSITITADSVSWYGAIIATISFFGTITIGTLEYLRDRSKVKITAKKGYKILTISGLENNPQIILTAINKGRRPVTLEGFCFNTKNGESLLYPFHPGITFPYELKEGKSYKFSVDEDGLTKDPKIKENPIKDTYFNFNR